MCALSIEADARRRLESLAVAGHPQEVCGLLLARAGRPERVADIWPLANLAADPRHAFAFDPVEYLHAERQADDRQLCVIGVWHTHPDATAVPSASDREGAWAGWFYLIVGTCSAGVLETRCWRLYDGYFVEEVFESCLP
jgi:proteasome lid subunit RPN8/RPN11